MLHRAAIPEHDSAGCSLCEAKVAAERAVALDPSLAEAHASLADVKLYVDWDFAGAEREFQRALPLDPNDATAHQILWVRNLFRKGTAVSANREFGGP